MSLSYDLRPDLVFGEIVNCIPVLESKVDSSVILGDIIVIDCMN